MSGLRFGSVCSGIEAASVAWHPLGWRAAWLAEIEPFPSAVLAHHYPDVPNLGDMTKLPERILSGEIEAPDIFCGGTPCQAFSVAGLRRSLDDHRGNLSLTFVEIADAIDQRRSVQQSDPAIIFWENVPGVLNTKDNAFGCFLAGLAGEDDALVAPGGRWADAGIVLGPKRAVAWRVLDAQYFSLAQRRKRVFVISSAREGFDPAAVLFEFEGLRRDSAPSREAGKDVAKCVTAGVAQRYDYDTEDFVPVTMRESGQGYWMQDTVSDTLRTDSNRNGKEGTIIGQPIAFTTEQTPKFNIDQALTLTKQSPTGGGQPMAVATPIAFSAKDYGGDATQDLSPTLRAMPHDGSHANGGGQVAVTVGALMSHHTPNGHGCAGVNNQQVQAGHVLPHPIGLDEEQNAMIDAFGTLKARTAGGGFEGSVMQTNMAVRRLTPVECERLQGFPDGYTDIPWRGKATSPDGPRYKALGNSWAVPVVAWIGKRIDDALRGETDLFGNPL